MIAIKTLRFGNGLYIEEKNVESFPSFNVDGLNKYKVKVPQPTAGGKYRLT